MTDRDTLTKIIRSVTDRWDEPLDEVHDVPQIVNAILAADWQLTAYRGATVAKALQDAAEDMPAEWYRAKNWLDERADRIEADDVE